MSSPNSVILYRYDSSPFSHKIDNVLSLKGVQHETVAVSPMLPRPEITDHLGIIYRRIPILAIGNDVYCDTSLIVSALERRFPTAKGYRTLFPSTTQGGKSDTGLIKAFSKFYADNTLFRLAASLIPWDKLPAPFVKDRSEFFGAPLDPKVMAARIPEAQTTISSHLLLVEQQLSDGREWLFNTETPSLADISVQFIIAWARAFDRENVVFDPKQNPHTLQWVDRVSAWIQKERKTQPAPREINGNTAAQKIVASNYESYDVVGFDKVEATRLGISLGDTVQVASEDTARNYPTTGKLIALSREEIILEVTGSKGLVRCHFPRLGFFVRPGATNKL